MKQKAKIPTIVGLVLLSLGVVAGVFLVNSRALFKISADVEAVPQNVRVSNISDSSITVTWTTEIKSKGFVKWGTNKTTLNKVALEENETESDVHSASIIGTKPGESIFFNINSNSKDYDNSGTAWEAKTSTTKVSPSGNLTISGQVVESDGSTPAKAIVYTTISGTILSSLTSNKGSYVIPASNYIESINDNNVIEISVQAGTSGSSQAIIYPKYAKYIPLIVLGKSYDFRSLTGEPATSQPESNVLVPESSTTSSRFENTPSNQNNENKTNNVSVSLDSHKDGEIITTTNPEFFGNGPSGTNIEILVESEPQSDNVSIDNSGKWNWSPPNDLEVGEHKITIKWKDQTGIVRTLTRSFVVSAAEGPAFVSTPSATPTQIASATTRSTSTPTSTLVSTSSATPTSTTTAKSTLQPTPETGSLTPTIWLFIMGIGMLSLSVYIIKNQNA